MSKTWNFGYTGNYQSFTTPYYGTYRIETWGAEGGTSYSGTNTNRGGYACGDVLLGPNTVLYIYVGGQGVNAPGNIDGGPNLTHAGGFNGGGYGCGTGGAGGGGGTDVRIGSSDISLRIVVAGGGGGDTVGGSSWARRDVSDCIYDFFQGQNMPPGYAGNYPRDNGGGGGGWYGGAGIGGDDPRWSYGGTSHVRSDLKNAIVLGGNETMPNPNGGTMVGNIGNGYARITIIQPMMRAFFITKDDKYYIPTKYFFNLDKDCFTPVTKDYVLNVANYCNFVYNTGDLNKRIYFNNKSFLPFEKIIDSSGYRITRIDYDITILTTNNQKLFNNVSNYLSNIVFDNYIWYPSNLSFKYNTNINNLDKYIVKVQHFKKSNNYSHDYLYLGYNPNVKIIIKNNEDGKFYGKDLKETSLDRILLDGIDGSEIESYNIKMFDFDIYMCFKNKCYTDEDELSILSFNSKNFSNMSLVNKIKYDCYHYIDDDKIQIKLQSAYDDMLIKVLDNTDIEIDETTLEKF